MLRPNSCKQKGKITDHRSPIYLFLVGLFIKPMKRKLFLKMRTQLLQDNLTQLDRNVAVLGMGRVILAYFAEFTVAQFMCPINKLNAQIPS